MSDMNMNNSRAHAQCMCAHMCAQTASNGSWCIDTIDVCYQGAPGEHCNHVKQLQALQSRQIHAVFKRRNGNTDHNTDIRRSYPKPASLNRKYPKKLEIPHRIPVSARHSQVVLTECTSFTRIILALVGPDREKPTFGFSE